MDRFSDVTVRDACLVQSQAEALAGVHLPRRAGGLVPPRWTAWLLMERAGMPRDLIAYVYYVTPDEIGRGVWVAKCLMLWAPYAATVEHLAGIMVPFGKPHIPTLKPARRIACAALAD